MFRELGELLGWLLVFVFIGTILNYCLKIINKRFSKVISEHPIGKKLMKVLMKIFVRNHKYFGLATGLFLLTHFIIQFSYYGANITGIIAGIILIMQMGFGIYGDIKKKPRKGVWFVIHRLIAALLILGIGIHLLIPYGLNTMVGRKNTPQVSESVEASKLKTFTLEELSKYNGENGSKIYVAYNGFVYDVTDVKAWSNGNHNGYSAGKDIMEEISKSPHGDSVFKKLEIVGKLSN